MRPVLCILLTAAALAALVPLLPLAGGAALAGDACRSDEELMAEVAIAFACVSVVASMVPLFGNGLGVRQWAIGLLAPVLTTYRLELGVTAELVNLAGELIMLLLLGTAGAAWLARRRST